MIEPKLVVFDLEQVFPLLLRCHRANPLDKKLKLRPDVAKIMQTLLGKNIKMAIASKHNPVSEATDFFNKTQIQIDGKPTFLKDIIPKSRFLVDPTVKTKRTQMQKLAKTTRISLTDILFFDDLKANGDVRKDGVRFFQVGRAGLDGKAFKAGMDYFAKKSPDSSDDDSSSEDSSDDSSSSDVSNSDVPTRGGSGSRGGGGGGGGGGGYLPSPPSTNNICGNPQCGQTMRRLSYLCYLVPVSPHALYHSIPTKHAGAHPSQSDSAGSPPGRGRGTYISKTISEEERDNLRPVEQPHGHKDLGHAGEDVQPRDEPDIDRRCGRVAVLVCAR
ncbi:acid phosphatase-domain-containing protein [Mycena olivaceomarginata]|nr:acid phosphatase-domain-containing protein [Mycena olivaceomarginata]